MSEKLRTLDLFSGCGGLSLGLEMVRPNGNQLFETVMAVDNWQAACDTFEKNFGLKPVCTSVDADEIPALLGGLGRIDIVVGGPPCQGFSTSGKRALDDERNTLVWAYLRAVQLTKPKVFVMENVSGFASFSGGQLLSEVKDFARGMGYFVRAAVLQASMHGVPQRRKRFVLVGSKIPDFQFPGETLELSFGIDSNGVDYEQSIDSSNELTFMDAVSDLPAIAAGGESAQYLASPQNEFQAAMRADVEELTMHRAVGHGAKMLELMKYIPQGKSAFDKEVFDLIPEEIRPKGGFKNSYARIRASTPAPTITRNFTTPSSANCIHPSQDRALSLREGARAQSFPDIFEFKGSLEEVRLQIGNAVPPLLGQSIGGAIARHLSLS